MPKRLVQFAFAAEKKIPGAPAPPALTGSACPNPTITGAFKLNATAANNTHLIALRGRLARCPRVRRCCPARFTEPGTDLLAPTRASCLARVPRGRGATVRQYVSAR